MRLVNDLVSVIVPAYNAESYIERCINSIGNQSYSNFEIIVINDGSNDLTFKILENLEKRYKMLNVYDQANHGEAYTRNRGLSLAKGEFVCFVDADDYIENNFIEKMLVPLIQNHDIGISVCNMQCIDQNNNRVHDIGIEYKKEILIKIDSSYSFQRSVQHLSVCAAMYRKQILKDLKFSEDIVVGLDALFHNIALTRCHSFYILPDELYVYDMHEGSIFKSGFSERRLTELKAWREIIKVYSDYPFAKKSAMGEYFIRCISVYKELYRSDANNIKKYSYLLKHQIRKSYKYIRYCELPFKIRVLCTAFFVAPELMGVIYKRYKHA